jgi:hypothetical protein
VHAAPGLQQREGGDGVDDGLAVLIDIGVAKQHVLTLLAHLRAHGHGTLARGRQIRDRELASRWYVSVVCAAACRETHGGIDERRQHTTVDGAGRVQMTVLGLKFQSSVSVLGVLRPYSKVPGETIHG